MSNINNSQILSNLQFHTKSFWNNFYQSLNKNNNNINWYFDITKVKIDDFSLNDLLKDEEILLIGPGLSSILDYLNNNGFDHVSIVDFSEELKKKLSEKYNKKWEVICYDITSKKSLFSNEFDKILDKGCLDCILSDKKNIDKKFISALNNLIISLDETSGILYYFSDGKLEDRINLFYQVPNIKYKVTTIDLNETMKEEYKEFNHDDNLYYLYTITRAK